MIATQCPVKSKHREHIWIETLSAQIAYVVDQQSDAIKVDRWCAGVEIPEAKR